MWKKIKENIDCVAVLFLSYLSVSSFFHPPPNHSWEKLETVFSISMTAVILPMGLYYVLKRSQHVRGGLLFSFIGAMYLPTLLYHFHLTGPWVFLAAGILGLIYPFLVFKCLPLTTKECLL